MTPYLTIVGMIVLIMFPIILPALITLVHKITGAQDRITSVEPTAAVLTQDPLYATYCGDLRPLAIRPSDTRRRRRRWCR